MPRTPIARPKPAATVDLAATMTHRAGWAVDRVGDRAVLDLGGEQQRADDDRASTVVSHVEKMNVSPTLNGRCVSGSVLTNMARIHDSRTPMTGVEREDRDVGSQRRHLDPFAAQCGGPDGQVVADVDRSVTRRTGDGADDVPWSMAGWWC